MKFELIAGQHSNRSGVYKKGDIVEANSNLEEKFRLKFKRRFDLENAADRDPVLGTTRKAAAAAPAGTKKVPLSKTPAPVVARNQRITNIAPAKPAATAKAGTAKPDAAAKALKKEAPEELAPQPEDNADPAAEQEEGAAPALISDEKLGEEVTSEFEGVPAAEFAVLKDGKGRYNLVDRDTPNEPVNAKPLDKDGIEALIKKLTD